MPIGESRVDPRVDALDFRSRREPVIAERRKSPIDPLNEINYVSI